MPTQINPYLTFNGNCEEAFAHYKAIFGGEYLHISRFKDMPAMPGMTVSDKDQERIMHVSLPINSQNILYGSDSNPNLGEVKWGKNITLSVAPDSKEEADRLYKMLSDGGKAHMPMADMFWGAYWGMCEDKFGINWMINVDRAA